MKIEVTDAPLNELDLRTALIAIAHATCSEDLLAEPLRKAAASVPESLFELQLMRQGLLRALRLLFQKVVTHLTGAATPGDAWREFAHEESGFHAPLLWKPGDYQGHIRGTVINAAELGYEDGTPAGTVLAEVSYLAALLGPEIDRVARQLDALPWLSPGERLTRLSPSLESDELKATLDGIAGASVRYAYHLGLLRRFKRDGFPTISFQVADDACPPCKLLLKDHRFVVDEILENVKQTGGFNSGPRASWVVLPTIHPHCRCRPYGHATRKVL